MGVSGSHSCGPFPHDAPPPDGRFFKATSTGLLIFTRSWSPPSDVAVRATVYVVHGYAEHSGRYEVFGRALAAAGFAVHALDWQGHGQSHGDRAHITSLDDVVADVLELATRVAPPAPNAPAFIFGHSFGGLIALRAVQSAAGAAAFRGAVLSAPALAVDPSIDSPLNRWLALTLTNVVPKLAVTPLDPRAICSDARVVEAYKRDPLVYHGAIRLRLGAEGIRGMGAAFAAAADTTVPLLLLHGTDDKVCPITGSRRLAVVLPPPRATLIEYSGAWHELLNEPAHAQPITADILEWLAQRIAAENATAMM